MNASLKLASTALTALLVAGCASTDGLTTHSTKNDPATLAAGRSLAAAKTSADAWPRGDWWKRFNDPQLDQLMDEALAGSPTLRVAQARARRALAIAQATESLL